MIYPTDGFCHFFTTAMPSRVPIQVNYGPMGKFTRAGNIVKCGYCRHWEDGWCPMVGEKKDPEERCIPHFERLPGVDDDA